MLLDTLLWLIVQALATHCSKKSMTDSKLLQQSGQAILQTLRACHESASNLDDRSMAPKLYIAGFRALNSILAALRAQHGMSTAELVDLLRHFFTYGNELDASTSGAQTELASTALATAFGSRSVQDIGPAGKGAYRPPHARRRSSSSTGKMHCLWIVSVHNDFLCRYVPHVHKQLCSIASLDWFMGSCKDHHIAQLHSLEITVCMSAIGIEAMKARCGFTTSILMLKSLTQCTQPAE